MRFVVCVHQHPTAIRVFGAVNQSHALGDLRKSKGLYFLTFTSVGLAPSDDQLVAFKRYVCWGYSEECRIQSDQTWFFIDLAYSCSELRDVRRPLFDVDIQNATFWPVPIEVAVEPRRWAQPQPWCSTICCVSWYSPYPAHSWSSVCRVSIGRFRICREICFVRSSLNPQNIFVVKRPAQKVGIKQ